MAGIQRSRGRHNQRKVRAGMTAEAVTSTAPAGFERYEPQSIPPNSSSSSKSSNPLYHIPGRSRTPRKTSAYERGMFDALIGPRAETHVEPTEIRAVHLSVSASGSMLMIRTDTTSGEGKKRVLDLSSTQYIDLTLPSGEEITIEVRSFARVEAPPAIVEEPLPAERFARCDLLVFAGGEL